MKNARCSRLRYVGAISLFALQGVYMASSSLAVCYSTPRMAVDAGAMSPSSSPASIKNGYRVTKIESDPVLGQRWAMIASCGHPEWPAFALATNGAVSLTFPQEAQRSLADGVRTAPVIRAGDVVRLWKQEKLLRIEVAGVSEESGGLGKTIRVRLLRRNADDQSIPEQFSGVIRGPSDVEIQP
jgi:hypothetical protein